MNVKTVKVFPIVKKKKRMKGDGRVGLASVSNIKKMMMLSSGA